MSEFLKKVKSTDEPTGGFALELALRLAQLADPTRAIEGWPHGHKTALKYKLPASQS